MRSEEFGKLIANALEVGAQAHPVRVEYERYLDRTTIHVLDRDQVLLRCSHVSWTCDHCHDDPPPRHTCPRCGATSRESA